MNTTVVVDILCFLSPWLAVSIAAAGRVPSLMLFLLSRQRNKERKLLNIIISEAPEESN
jgi:hypothetical protein